MNQENKTPEAPSDSPNTEIGPVEEFKTLKLDVEALLARQFAGYAGPLSWGPWVQIASHGGVVSYDISYSVIGDTLVHGSVNYYGAGGWRTDVFRDSTRITTGNAWAVVKVCFHGNPFGSAIHGRVNP